MLYVCVLKAMLGSEGRKEEGSSCVRGILSYPPTFSTNACSTD